MEVLSPRGLSPAGPRPDPAAHLPTAKGVEEEEEGEDWNKENREVASPRGGEGKRQQQVKSHPVFPLGSDWPNYPLLVTQSDPKSQEVGKVVPVNAELIDVDSSLFRGKTFIFVNTGRTSQDGAAQATAAAEHHHRSPHQHQRGHEGLEDLEELGKRRSSFTLKGRFKRRVRFADLLIGHEFNDGVIYPPKWQRAIILGFLERFFPHLKVSLTRKCASAMAPVAIECRRLRVRDLSADADNGNTDECGHELFNVEESTALLGGYFAEKRRSPKERMKFFGRRKNLEDFWFEPGYEYTFEFFQKNLSFVDYKLRFGLISLGIGRIVKGRPVQFLIKHAATREYLCYFQFWSEKLLKCWM